MGPDQIVFVGCQPDKAQSHQWRLAQIKPAPKIQRQPIVQSGRLLLFGHGTPIKNLERQPAVAVNQLYRFAELLPKESGAKNGMARHCALPGCAECVRPEFALDRPAHLFDVYPNIRLIKSME